MKRFFTPLLLVCLLLSNTTKAAFVEILVTSNQFAPSNTNVIIGDVVSFKFSTGFHNAISSGAVIPVGAMEINSGEAITGTRTYNYTVTKAGTYHYYCVNHGTSTGIGMVGTFTASAPLPVTLKEFLVVPSAKKLPVLTWRTLTEQNVNYFSVRSSTDGKQFTEIIKVMAKGNSNTEQVYNYTDNKVSNQHRYVYYELVTIDKDGKEGYSPIKLFKTAFAGGVLVVQLGPNPIKKPGQLMVQFNAEKAGSVIVNVFNANGRRELSTKLSAFPGLNNGHVHVCDLAPGIYTLQFNYEGLRETKKIVVN